MLNDLRHAIRSLARHRGLALTAVLTLAAGIGATTAIFSAVYHVLVRPLPYDNAERLGTAWLQESSAQMLVTPKPEQIASWKAHTRELEAIESYEPVQLTLAGMSEPEIIAAMRISRTLPATLEQQPLRGRLFDESEMVPNARRVVMLSEGFWQRRFGGRADAIGSTLELDGERHEIIGVLPNELAAFTTARETQLWLPLVIDSTTRNLSALVVLRPGATTESAAADLARINTDVPMAHAESGLTWSPRIMTYREISEGPTQHTLPLLFAAVAVVLFIACANIAGLLLVRMASRSREFAIRAAIGAGRFAIARLVAAEALVLAAIGGVLGTLLAWWLTDLVRVIRPDNLNALDATRINPTTLLFACGLTMLSAVLFGVAPALAAMRTDPQGTLIGGGHGARTTGSNRFRAVLVTGQIALSMVLLVSAVLLVRSVASAGQAQLGYDTENVITTALPLRSERYPTNEARRALYEQLDERLRALPGVQSVTAASGIPTTFGVAVGKLRIQERTLPDDMFGNFVSWAAVTPEYFETFGIPIVAGSGFVEGDAGRDVVVINRGLADRLWPGENPVGRQLAIGADGEWDTVIGIAQDIALGGVPNPSGTTPNFRSVQIYAPNNFGFGGYIALRVAGDPDLVLSRLRATAAEVDPQLALTDVATMETLVADTIALDRFFMMMLVAFAGTGLLLSVVGLYGVISTAVAQRTPEIGIRVALGATPASIRTLVLRQAVVLTTAGLAAGIASGLALTRLLESLLFGVGERDPLSFAVATLVLGAGALMATWLPMRRAARIDPLTALRT